MDSKESVKSYIENIQCTVFKRGLKDVEILSGGYSNYVYRLTFEDNSTCVLKYFPQYWTYDRSKPRSQDRYFVEKNALLIFENEPWESVYPDSKIRIPKVIHYDDQKFVIIMEDAGSHCLTLFSILSNASNSLYKNELIEHIARLIFVFLDYISCKSNITLRTHRKQFENMQGWDTAGGYVRGLLRDKSNLFETDNELQPFVDKLDHLFNPVSDDEAVFSFGDLWPNSILVDVENKYVWIVDWEMARFASKQNDLEHLMSNLWLMNLSENLYNKSRVQLLMQNLQLQFFANKDADWRFNSGNNTKDEFVLYITCLVRYDQNFAIKDKRGTILKAIEEINNH